ncbi:hypothetical protein CferDRAFT_1657 [Chlorobium ferrooxidans DSM 13031]|uniref:Uncharacterized protein n=1 Tax=Chlorobium ferrooxidans DSM 13031 TaxID=377431 RepID=Q0YTJ6_9CHLB|nr:hypothetical protein CferDRAFT_1657 [Chlorobium ferrooxidans DSM 13031]
MCRKKKALKYNNRIHNYCFPEKQLPTQGEHKINAGTSRGVSGCYYQVIKATAQSSTHLYHHQPKSISSRCLRYRQDQQLIS